MNRKNHRILSLKELIAKSIQDSAKIYHENSDNKIVEYIYLYINGDKEYIRTIYLN